jgi:predicted PurR-regulated permease PerM
LTTLASELPRYQAQMERKVERYRSQEQNAFTKASEVVGNVADKLQTSPLDAQRKVQDVNVVSQPSFRQRLEDTVGPYLESLGVGSFVLILVLFMLMNREDVSDRLVRLFGQRRVSLTTKTMDEVGQRISRFLAVMAMLNSSFGLIIGLGLWAIGVPYAILWGFLAGALRFIPYVGAAISFLLPLIFSIAFFETWREPILVFALFAVIETVANSFLEPIIYGKTTGVSALGLLVAAMFWTWLWGGLGLLLSTPMTVCLAVLGKYVPGLRFFATMLGEEPALEPDVRFYQRLLAMDQDGATAIIEAAMKKQHRIEIFEEYLIPTLARCERDRIEGDIEEREQVFIWRIIGDLLDDLSETPELTLSSVAAEAPAAGGADVATPFKIAGVAANDNADTLILRMLKLSLGAARVELELLANPETPMKLNDLVSDYDPDMVILSHVPPGGATTARYLVRRLRARFADLPVVVGRWLEASDTTGEDERLTSVGASNVVFRLTDARDLILKQIAPKTTVDPAATPAVPAPAVV